MGCLTVVLSIAFQKSNGILQALDKQKQKTEDEKKNQDVLKKDNQALMDSCQDLERRRQKFEHDIHTKDARISCLEGQLSQTKKSLEVQTNKVKFELDTQMFMNSIVTYFIRNHLSHFVG